MADLEEILIRASEIFLDDLSDETDAELGELLPPLVEAGYVAIDGESPTGHFWRSRNAVCSVRRKSASSSDISRTLAQSTHRFGPA